MFGHDARVPHERRHDMKAPFSDRVFGIVLQNFQRALSDEYHFEIVQNAPGHDVIFVDGAFQPIYITDVGIELRHADLTDLFIHLFFRLKICGHPPLLFSVYHKRPKKSICRKKNYGRRESDAAPDGF